MSLFTGAGVAIVTPMHEDETVNYEKLAEILEEQIAGGTDAIIICGTTGESSTLSHQEHVDVIRFTIEKAGADGLLLVTPYYNKATQKGLIDHYTRIAKSVQIPVILYNVPSRTGVNILPETAVYLAEHVPNIVGIKEASGNISQIAKLMSLAEGRIELYSGNDDQVVPLLALGARGVISVLSNVAPKETHEMVASWMAGDTARSLQIQMDMIDLIGALFCEVNPIPVKTAMNLMGKEVGPLRSPLCEMEEKNLERLKASMKKAGLI